MWYFVEIKTNKILENIGMMKYEINKGEKHEKCEM